MKLPHRPAGAKVLIVDDDEFNRLCLSAPLERLDCFIDEAKDGQEALDRVAQKRPDIILLDLMMPKIDGIEVCRRLKASEATAMIPILMVTALDDQEHRLRAIEAGADDFLNKPVDMNEVVLRVGNAVRAKRTYDALQKSHDDLAHVQRAQNELTNMVVHDLRGPLAVAVGHVDLLELDLDDRLTDAEREMLEIAREGLLQINNMSQTLLDIQRSDADKLVPKRQKIDLLQLCSQLLASFRHLLSSRRLEIQCEDEKVSCLGDEELLRRLLTNLLINAHKFTQKDGLIRLHLDQDDHSVRVVCEDDGPGIPEELLPSLFERHTQGETAMKHRGLGIGLAFCKLAALAHSGTLEVESQPGQGARFCLTLPKT